MKNSPAKIWATAVLGLAFTASGIMFYLNKNAGPGTDIIEANRIVQKATSTTSAAEPSQPMSDTVAAPETQASAPTERLSSHTDLKKEYENLEDQQIVDELQEIDRQMEAEQWVEKANAGQLDEQQTIQFKGLLRKRTALMGVQTERLLSQK